MRAGSWDNRERTDHDGHRCHVKHVRSPDGTTGRAAWRTEDEAVIKTLKPTKRKKKTLKTPKGMPKTIYVTWDDTDVGGERYLIADTDTDGINDGDAVGIYELRQVRRKVVKHELA